MKINSYPQKLPLKEPFVLSHGTYHFREALIVELEEGDHKGYGEATAITYYGKTLDSFIRQLEDQAEAICALELPADSITFPDVPLFFPDEPFLQSAVDCAYWDLWSRKAGKPLNQLIEQKSPPLSAFTLSGSADRIGRALARAEWPIYKVKMGGSSDEAILTELTKYSNDCDIRIDANGGWSLEEALDFIPRLTSAGITFIEQPLPPEQDHHMPQLKAETQAQLWADESAQEATHFKNLVSGFHGLNLKLMKSGGISPVLNQIEAVRNLDLQVGLGCMTESSFGISALAQIAGLADQLDMDGNMLLAQDPARGAYIEKGRVMLPQGTGLGCSWRVSPQELHP